MKTLKFRAWHKTKKKMFEVKCIEFGSCIWSKDGNWFVPISEVEIMQFTGLLDRHGNEIYEGDILRYSDGEILGVAFNNRTAQFTTKTRWLWTIIDVCEIVGNIYDNPELLEGE